MNLDSNRTVTSKYFSKTSMDESLSEFREVKQSCTGPKTTQKPSKSKAKKITKRVKGQKDIRTALKGKKNELISYAKEFDNVCKASGVDVDSEQLQLAIALSKSLQTESDSSDKSQSLSSQERAGKIRRTLQEYGFKVPEIKISSNKRKKHQKKYKLLLTSDEERKQLISEKYTNILFNNLNTGKLYDNCDSKYLDAPLFNLSTNALYESLKDDTVFYVENLVEKSTSFGTLLRNWSDIPGRPISPEFFHSYTMNFNKIECSQDEIDIVLGGSVNNAQSIIKSKQINKVVPNLEPPKIILDNVSEVECGDRTLIENDAIRLNTLNIKDSDNKTKEYPIQSYRSCSPDIFDDEISSIMDITKHTIIVTEENKTKLFTEDNFMELTECANVVSQNSFKPSQLSQNATKRKSNDFMEITECVMISSQPITQNSDKIDLTQSPDLIENIDNENLATPIIVKPLELNLEDMTDVTQNSKHATVIVNIDNSKETNKETDLNQSEAHIDCGEYGISERSNHSIDLTQNSSSYNNVAIPNKGLNSMDLTQSSNSSDDLPFVNLNAKQVFLDHTIILDENDYMCDNGAVRCSIKLNIENKTVDLTQEVKDVCIVEDKANHVTNQSFFDEFVHEHSESIEYIEGDVYPNNLSNRSENYESDIDLTQDSDSSSATHFNSGTPQKINNSSLGRKDDVSIDYDEIPNNINRKASVINLEDDSNEDLNIHKNIPTIDSNNDLVSNSSQNTEFDISDKEFDYSLHKSRHEIVNNFDFGGISVLDDVNKVKGFDDCENGFLTEVDVESNKMTKISDPCNGLSKHDEVGIKTPNNSEFIVKTNEVTPILDYASMTTPQRNSELDKYGLKPFKRKRAIQLLTHLYNQTHPIITPYSTEGPSPSKRRREEASPQKKSPAKLSKRNKNPSSQSSPRKRCDSPKSCHSNENVKENVCGYNIATEIPDIRNIECSPDDWVFQKREKAKVHSCRVPLHIAFHNYVSSRRELREAILRYEPVNIDVIHKELVSYGHRYDPKDLLKFLDKKCITVKTTDNNARNNKR